MKKLSALILAVILFITAVSAKESVSLENATIEEMQKALSYGLISCEELTLYCLDRIEKYNQEYNCFITLFDNALEKAKEKDEQLQNGTAKGKLFGIPVVVKDNMDIAGYPTTNGYSFENADTASSNAKVVQALIDEGAIIIGKTNMSAGAEDARSSKSEAIGHTANAYNPLLTPGGSSGGSAVAVSLNFAFLGLGTDTNSSLRVPAALNGCIALRSTYGLIPTEGIVPLNETRDVAGALTDNAYDQALIMDILTDFKYSYTENLNSNALSGARIGIVSDLVFDKKADKEILAAFKNAIDEFLELGAQVELVLFPELEEYAETASYWDSEYYREELYALYEKVMEEKELDALVYPSMLSSPIPLGEKEEMNSQSWLNNTWMLSSTTGCPEITVPIGLHSEGSGIGMEIASLYNNEQLLLDIAYTYTSKYNHRVIPIEDQSKITLASLFAEYEREQAQQEEQQSEAKQSQNKNPYSGALIGSAAIIVLLAFAAWQSKRVG